MNRSGAEPPFETGPPADRAGLARPTLAAQWRNVRLIFHREVRDQLRDRRTLFMVLVLPLLLYPALGIGMVQLNFIFTEQPRTVVVIGSQHLPPPPLIENGQFVPGWFPGLEDDTRRLRVISDGDEPASPEHRELLESARRIAVLADERARLEQEIPQEQRAGHGKLARLRNQLATSFALSGIQVLIVVPEGFKEQIEEVNRALRQRAPVTTEYPRPNVYHSKADEKSILAFGLVRAALDNWEEALLVERLDAANLPLNLPRPVAPVEQDLALDAQKTANIWSKLLPAMLVIMAVTGAFYPAIDLAAGEKERGTMETLLISPATRTEIVLGKFLTVMLFSVATAVLNLVSMGFTTRHMLSVIGRHAGEFDISLPPASSIVILLVLLVPLSAFFSAVCLALATFARSSKEGQYYLTPMLMVTMGLTVFCLSPGVELTSSTAFYGILPIAGVALLLKGLLLNPQNGELYWLSIPVLVSSVGYSVAAIWWAIDQFRREEVLFREAEKFELRIWLKHLLRDKEPTPSFSEAVFCMVLFLVLMFVALGPLSSAGVNPDGTPNPRGALRAALIQQIGLYATPPLIMAVMLTSDFRRTMRLRWPGFRALGLGAALGICCLPLTLTLSRFVAPFFPPLPESLTKQISGMADPSLGWWFVLLVFAGAPAICEELAFRGFLLSGFHARGRTALAIILSAVCFGLVHMVPQQAFNAMLLGLLLGLLALRTQSLWPGVLMHFLNNALALGHGWATKELAEGRWSGNPFVAAALQQTPDGLQFTPLVVLVCAGVAAWVVRTLVLMPDLPTSPKAVPRSSGTARRPAAPAARVRVTEPESPVAAGRV